MSIITKKVQDLTPVEYKACLQANFGKWEGTMWEALVEARFAPDGSMAIMLWEGPDDTVRSLKGWALLSPIGPHCILHVTPTGRKRCTYVAQFWVKRPYRRKGLGGILVEEVYKHDKRPYIYTHDYITGELVKGRTFTTDKHSRKNVPKNKKPIAA